LGVIYSSGVHNWFMLICMLISIEEKMPPLMIETTKISSFELHVSCAMIVIFSVTTVIEWCQYWRLLCSWLIWWCV